MRYYYENTGQELTKTGVGKAVNPTTLKRGWGAADVIDMGFKLIIETPKPEITTLQAVQNGGTEDNGDGTRSRVWVVNDKFADIPDGPTKEEQETAFLAEELSTTKVRVQDSNRQSCEAFILNLYPEPIQRSAALGVYPAEIVDAMADHIARCIAEENRVYDLIEAATDMTVLEAIQTPVYPEI